MDRPCLNPTDPDCPLTAPNKNSTKVGTQEQQAQAFSSEYPCIHATFICFGKTECLQPLTVICPHVVFIAPAIRCGAGPKWRLPWSVQEVHALAGGTDCRRDHQERQRTPAQVTYPNLHIHTLINTAVITAALVLERECVFLFFYALRNGACMRACAPCAVNLAVISRFQ